MSRALDEIMEQFELKMIGRLPRTPGAERNDGFSK